MFPTNTIIWVHRLLGTSEYAHCKYIVDLEGFHKNEKLLLSIDRFLQLYISGRDPK